MDRVPSDPTCLDGLAARALAGDEDARSRLFEDLHVRFTRLAKKRVRPDNVEDVVMDALKIVLDKYTARPDPGGLLTWSLTVLRNVIGNHYQSRKRRDDRHTHVEDWQTLSDAAVLEDPTAALAEEQFTDRLERALETLAAKAPRCGALFAGLLRSYGEGGGKREVSTRALEYVRRDHPEMNANAFYVALHRCRARLRGILEAPEGSPSHG